MTAPLRLILAAACLPALACGGGARGGDEPAPARQEIRADGTCAAHGLPASLCTRCSPALAAVFQARGDWCAEHGVPESICPECGGRALAAGAGHAGPPADWCAGHGLPESSCTKCNPDLIATFQAAGDWCAEHGFPESACPACNPRKPPGSAADWCTGHGLPESSCTKCNPGLIATFQAAGDWCAEHGFPESACPACNPQVPPPRVAEAAIEARTVRLQSAEVEEAAAFETVTARSAAAAAYIESTARIAFDADRIAEVRAILPGIVRRVRVQLGAHVLAGDPMFDLESTHVGDIQGTLQAARQRVRTAAANVDRARALAGQGIASAREVEVAEQELAAAQAQQRAAETSLRVVGARGASTTGMTTLTAPLSGTVVRRPAVVGLLAMEDVSLATVADTSLTWAICDVPEADAPRLAHGQEVELTIEGLADRAFRGTVTWISSEVDPHTRTVAARAEVPNPDGLLRANQFARARISASPLRTAVTVPRAAVQRVGDREVVFVRSAPGVYQPRVVRRRGHGELVQVEGRVRPGDEVVTTGAVLLRTEILPGSIGAGCCEVELPGGD